MKFIKLLRTFFLRNTSSGCFWYDSETYDMAGSRTIALEGNCPPTPKLILTLTPTLTEEKYSSGAIVWLPSNSKANPKLDPNHNPNWGQISSGGNYPDIDTVWGAIVRTPIYLFIYLFSLYIKLTKYI